MDIGQQWLATCAGIFLNLIFFLALLNIGFAVVGATTFLYLSLFIRSCVTPNVATLFDAHKSNLECDDDYGQLSINLLCCSLSHLDFVWPLFLFSYTNYYIKKLDAVLKTHYFYK